MYPGRVWNKALGARILESCCLFLSFVCRTRGETVCLSLPGIWPWRCFRFVSDEGAWLTEFYYAGYLEAARRIQTSARCLEHSRDTHNACVALMPLNLG
jgi:hypothetical protein